MTADADVVPALFHVEQLRYIVVELKVNKLTGGDVGQLSTYVAMVNDRLRRPGLHVVDRLAGDLRAAFPEMRRLSRSGAETGESRTARRSRRAGSVATWRPLRRRAGRVHGQT